MATWQCYVPIEYQAQAYKTGLQKDPPPYFVDLMESVRIASANLVVFWCTIYCVKASFLALYWHIFQTSKRFRVAWRVLVVYCVKFCGYTCVVLLEVWESEDAYQYR
jgi:hypothetical protein